MLLVLSGTRELSHLLSADTRAVKTEPCPHCWLCLAPLLPTQPSFPLWVPWEVSGGASTAAAGAQRDRPLRGEEQQIPGWVLAELVGYGALLG